MKALVIGVGMQGRAVVEDLNKNPIITEIVAADMDSAAVEKHLAPLNSSKTIPASVNVQKKPELENLISKTDPDIIICMVPAHLGYIVAEAALKAGVHFCSTSYTGRLAELDEEAQRRGVTILPEMGLDPGIDLVLCGLAIAELEEVRGLYSYGSGVPEPAGCNGNPLKYKINWTFDGVLNSYKRPARLLRNGKEVNISANDIFRPDNIHLINIPNVGEMEAYPNGDAIQFIKKFNLDKNLRHMGRFAMRWPGHSLFWQAMIDLGFLEDTPVRIEDANILPQRFLAAHLSPRLQYADHERDMVILRIHAWGIKDGKEANVICELVDYRSLETGFFAMNRTVGYTASIAAQLILSGVIRQNGVLSPTEHVPGDILIKQLKNRGISINSRIEVNR